MWNSGYVGNDSARLLLPCLCRSFQPRGGWLLPERIPIRSAAKFVDPIAVYHLPCEETACWVHKTQAIVCRKEGDHLLLQ